MKWRAKKGFVLAEVMLAALIAAFAICGILLMYVTGLDLIRTSKNASIATSAAQGLMEEIRNIPFLCLTCACGGCSAKDNLKCQSYTCYNHLQFSVNGVASSRGIVYVDPNPDPNSELLSVVISVCWRQGNKVIGEDLNLNGVLDAGEDINGNGRIDSTVELVTQVANR